VTALARFGSAARGDPIYDAGVQLGKLLRTAFLADCFVNAGFRRELRRVLNRGEAVNALKRAIYTGRVALAQARLRPLVGDPPAEHTQRDPWFGAYRRLPRARPRVRLFPIASSKHANAHGLTERQIFR
jgi:hypothetical protein